MGGTAAYASLTARALGLQPGIVTSVGQDVSLAPIDDIPIAGVWSEHSTTFENIHTNGNRSQYLRHVASNIQPNLVPDSWRSSPVVHFAPLAQEIDLDLLRIFPDSMICLTLQGWLRAWNRQGIVHPAEWPEAGFVLQKADAAVMSIEDIAGNWEIAHEFAEASEILVVTEGALGGRVFVQGEEISYSTPVVEEVDPVGAGDIFAAAFFNQLYRNQDPLDSAEFAAILAANSVTRVGLDSVPSPGEIHQILQRIY
jgi:sugar/nucleoside kinase (ribokinase family)